MHVLLFVSKTFKTENKHTLRPKEMIHMFVAYGDLDSIF